jgi:hypothetical protein
MFLKFFSYLILFFLLAVLQISFASGLPWYFREINFFIIFLVFFLEFDRKNIFWWFFLTGFILDFYYSSPFGFFMVFLPVVFSFAKTLSLNFFTNRSLYSCTGLTFFTTIFYYFSFNFIFYLLNFSGEFWLFVFEKNFWLSLFFGLIINLSASAAVFYFAGVLSENFKPFFIIREKR